MSEAAPATDPEPTPAPEPAPEPTPAQSLTLPRTPRLIRRRNRTRKETARQILPRAQTPSQSPHQNLTGRKTGSRRQPVIMPGTTKKHSSGHKPKPWVTSSAVHAVTNGYAKTTGMSKKVYVQKMRHALLSRWRQPRQKGRRSRYGKRRLKPKYLRAK